jgi:hypothetical protein
MDGRDAPRLEEVPRDAELARRPDGDDLVLVLGAVALEDMAPARPRHEKGASDRPRERTGRRGEAAAHLSVEMTFALTCGWIRPTVSTRLTSESDGVVWNDTGLHTRTSRHGHRTTRAQGVPRLRCSAIATTSVSVQQAGSHGGHALIPYAIVSSVRLSFSTSVFMSGIGIDDPAAMPVLSPRAQLSARIQHDDETTVRTAVG